MLPIVYKTIFIRIFIPFSHALFHKGAQTGKLIVGKNYNLRCKLALTALHRKVYIKSNGTKVLLHALFFFIGMRYVACVLPNSFTR